MKKSILLAISIFAAVSVISCSKSQQPETDNKGIKIDITVGDLEPSTKAVKTGWGMGDVINVFLGSTSSVTPDFTLTYDGSDWKASTPSSEVISTLEANPSGTIKGFYEASNGTTFTTGVYLGCYWYPHEEYVTSLDKYKKTGYLTTYFNNISYTYSSGTLTANINSWKFHTTAQIVVSGLTFEEGRYVLSCESNAVKAQSYIRISDAYGIQTDSLEDRLIDGISNDDGVAFVGVIQSEYDKTDPQPLTLTLHDLVDNKQYTCTNPSAVLYSASWSKLCAIKIPRKYFN